MSRSLHRRRGQETPLVVIPSEGAIDTEHPSRNAQVIAYGNKKVKHNPFRAAGGRVGVGGVGVGGAGTGHAVPDKKSLHCSRAGMNLSPLV